MNHDKYREMLFLYIYNELSKEERNEFERHMLGCRACKEELEELKKLSDLVKSEILEDLDEDAFFESRQELLAQLRNLNRKKFRFSKIWEFLSTPTSGNLKLAYSAASVLILFIVAYFAFFNKQDVQFQPKKGIAQIESNVSNLQFINSDFDKGEVEITYDQITPVKIKGNVNDPEIQKILAQSLIDSKNPGVRLKTVNAILSEKGKITTAVLKDALINAMKYDKNPGVRKEALSALCNLQFDDEILNAMIFVLQNDENSGLRIQAINCLDVMSERQNITDPNTLNVLRKKIEEDENSYIKLRAKTILTKLES